MAEVGLEPRALTLVPVCLAAKSDWLDVMSCQVESGLPAPSLHLLFWRPFIQPWGLKLVLSSPMFLRDAVHLRWFQEMWYVIKTRSPETLWGQAEWEAGHGAAEHGGHFLSDFPLGGLTLECVTPSGEKLSILPPLCETAGCCDLRAVTLTTGELLP